MPRLALGALVLGALGGRLALGGGLVLRDTVAVLLVVDVPRLVGELLGFLLGPGVGWESVCVPQEVAGQREAREQEEGVSRSAGDQTTKWLGTHNVEPAVSPHVGVVVVDLVVRERKGARARAFALCGCLCRRRRERARPALLRSPLVGASIALHESNHPRGGSNPSSSLPATPA
jgi:hypothetical protein